MPQPHCRYGHLLLWWDHIYHTTKPSQWATQQLAIHYLLLMITTDLHPLQQEPLLIIITIQQVTYYQLSHHHIRTSEFCTTT
jgi:hypothetical protein